MEIDKNLEILYEFIEELGEAASYAIRKQISTLQVNKELLFKNILLTIKNNKMNYLTIQPENILPIARELNQLLADYHVYYQKLRNFHWNIVGKNFFELHNKFEEMYKDARVKIDEIAERILTLQYHPISRYSRYLKISNISEESPFQTDSDMVYTLLDDHKTLLHQMNKVLKRAEEVNDEGTVDLISGYIASLEKTSWMLTAWSKSTVEQLKEDLVLQS